LFEIGNIIRQKYGEILPINPHQVHVRSFENDLCLQSGATLMAGAFPPQERWKWNQDLNWQPFSIYTVPHSQDNVNDYCNYLELAYEGCSRS
jgi:PREDICTED: similar to acid phosphatase, prostate long, partial